MRGSTRSSCPHPAAAEHTEFTGLFKKYFYILVFAFIGFFFFLADRAEPLHQVCSRHIKSHSSQHTWKEPTTLTSEPLLHEKHHAFWTVDTNQKKIRKIKAFVASLNRRVIGS